MVLSSLLLGSFVAAIYAAAGLTVFALYRLACNWRDPWGLAVAALLLVLGGIPLTTNAWTDWFIAVCCRAAGSYFPIRVVEEDPDALKPGHAYVLAYEPHSALPVGIPAVFATNSPLRKALRGELHGMASSVCFRVPIVRQLWWWLGVRPVSRALLDSLLTSRKSVLLCPGGVQECLYMDQAGVTETVYLQKRQGFVRMAIKHGAPIVPVFAFGQGKSYSWYRPGPPLVPTRFVHWLSRVMGAVPLTIWGSTVVLGRPIEVPQVAQPSHELVEQYLHAYITQLTALFERHKAACGCGGMQLRVM